MRVETVLRETGFFDYAATLGMKREDFIKAIEMAPSIKPFRHTYLHEETYRSLQRRLFWRMRSCREGIGVRKNTLIAMLELLFSKTPKWKKKGS